MHFAQPAFLIVAFVAGVTLVGLFAHLALARRRALAQLGSSHLLSGLTASVSRVRRRLREAMVVAGVVLVAVALARPQLGYRFEEAHRRGVDVLFAVDTSKSMLTPDVKPNRLERAKLAVRDLVRKFPDDRVGLVAFAGNAFLETPLTLDHAIFEQSLDGLDTNVIPLGGTDVASAIQEAAKALADDDHKKVLVLLTDGEDLAGDALSTADAAAKQGLVIYTVGVGTPRGELIPLASKSGRTEFVKDADGKFVTSRLDESLLRRIAAATGGSYRSLGDNGQGLDALYREELSKLPRSDLAARSERVPVERYQWPLGLGLLLLGLEPLVGERRRARSVATRERRWFSRRAVAATAAVASLLLVAPAAWASAQSAERAYQQGKFAKAQTDYAGAAKDRPDPKLDFNVGDAAYRNGDLDAATKGFEAALHTDDLKLQEHAYYNLGDALYRGGEQTLKADKKDDTIRAWKQAVSDYEAALRLDAKDGDAQFNRDFVKGRLAELEKQQQEQQPKDEKKDGKSGSKNDRGDKDDQSRSGGQDSRDEGSSKSNGQDRGKGKPGANSKDGKPGPNGKPSTPQGPQGQQGPQNQPGQSGQPNGTSESKSPQPGTPGTTPPGDKAEQEAPSRPGELSKGEASALLDSLRGELQLKPRAPTRPEAPAQDEPQKDW